MVRLQRLSFTADLLIAIGGDYGTLTEIAYVLNMRKPVIGLDTWGIPGITKAATLKILRLTAGQRWRENGMQAWNAFVRINSKGGNYIMRKRVLTNTIYLLLSMFSLGVAVAGADVTFPGTVPLYQDPVIKTVPETPPVTAPVPNKPPAEPSTVTPPTHEPPPDSPPPPEPDPTPPPESDPVEQPQQ